MKEKHNLKYVVDLRYDSEIKTAPDKLNGTEGITYYNFPLCIPKDQMKELIKGDINLYDYVVEFLADDNVVYGKGITMGIYVSKDEMVDIYYLYNHTDSDIDVTIADKNDKPGRNTVYHGILELVMGLGCVVTIIKKGY